jgi:hypothetical protein
MPQSFYRIEGRQVFPKDWGDYGDILQHGMSMHLERQDGKISLERTGPYIPPITFPMAIVLSSEARGLLESSGLSGFSFLPVVKGHIAEVHWDEWDLNLEEPPEFPESGEPEDYILAEPHSPTASDALGELWEVTVPTTATIIRRRAILQFDEELRLDSSTWNGEDLFKGGGCGYVLFTERARDWFTKVWGQFVMFDLFPSI